jgi:hypothetical protein
MGGGGNREREEYSPHGYARAWLRTYPGRDEKNCEAFKSGMAFRGEGRLMFICTIRMNEGPGV